MTLCSRSCMAFSSVARVPAAGMGGVIGVLGVCGAGRMQSRGGPAGARHTQLPLAAALRTAANPPVPSSSKPQGIQPAVLRLKAPTRPNLSMKNATKTGPRPAPTRSGQAGSTMVLKVGLEALRQTPYISSAALHLLRSPPNQPARPPAPPTPPAPPAPPTLAQVVQHCLQRQRNAPGLRLVHVEHHGAAAAAASCVGSWAGRRRKGGLGVAAGGGGRMTGEDKGEQGGRSPTVHIS